MRSPFSPPLRKQVRPHSVVLEMCKSRSGLTALNDSRLLDEVN
jgi:hypothetical protein